MTRLKDRLTKWMTVPWARAQARFQRARPGSVLIMVVALLVLLALMGTAYISSARIERFSAAASGGQRMLRESSETYATQLFERVKNAIATDAGNTVTSPTDQAAGTLFLAAKPILLPDLVQFGAS